MSDVSSRTSRDAARFKRLRWLRRVSQAAFLFLFVFLLLKTNIDSLATPDELPRISAPVDFFLEINPLIALGTVLSTHTLYRNLYYALVVIVLTLFLGRFFCGWVCPMGTINHMLASLRSGRMKGITRLENNRYRPAQRWKYIILTVLLAAAAMGSLQVGLLDPISLLTRSLTLVILPAWNVLMQDAYSWSLHGDTGVLSPLQVPVSWFVHKLLLRTQVVLFEQTGLILLLFLGILAANRYITRFWCRMLCPLGALFGIMSKTAILGLEKQPSMCTNCNRCALHCQGGDNPEPGMTWHQSECHLCLNCVASCPEAGIAFRFFNDTTASTREVNVTRRTLMLSVGAGVAAVPLLRTAIHPDATPNPSLVRPPGSIPERDFLARCVRCGECMNVCPNNALHPTLLQAGIEGVWSPMLIPRIGYCEPTCVLCSQVCPTGAINEITEAEKAWVPPAEGGGTTYPPLRIGTAFYDLGRCLPWAMGKECIVCEEWCPTTPKAIYFDYAEFTTREGDYVWLKRPHVDPAICVGCGACTYACPVKGAPAIYITAVGETRNPRNSILLDVPRPKGFEHS